MKKLTVVSALLMGLFAQGAFAATNNAGAADGTITFTGTVTDAPCVVDTSSANQIVPLGQIKTSAVTGTDGADLKHSTPFNIVLKNCAATLSDGKTAWDKMSVMFTDNADASNVTKVLENTGTASGISIGLKDMKDADITLGTVSADIAMVKGASVQTLPFKAHFVKVGTTAGTVGTVEAKADFLVEYK